MAGDGSDQRALQYEQTLVSPWNFGRRSQFVLPTRLHSSAAARSLSKKDSTQGKSVRGHAVRARRMDRRVCVALADSAGGCASANKRCTSAART